MGRLLRLVLAGAAACAGCAGTPQKVAAPVESAPPAGLQPRSPRLGYVVLYVEDIDRALAFYTGTLGFKERVRQGPYAELETGNTTLCLVERTYVHETFGHSIPPPGQGASEVGVLVDERPHVDELFQRAVKGGATPVAEPKDEPWGQRVSYVRDPDGHLLEICSPVGRS